MEKLDICEGCDNINSIEFFEGDLVYTCPLCGCINKIEIPKRYRGSVSIISPELVCELNMGDTETLDDGQEGTIHIIDGEEDLDEALSVLIRYGWSVNFKGSQINKDIDEGEITDDGDETTDIE